MREGEKRKSQAFKLIRKIFENNKRPFNTRFVLDYSQVREKERQIIDFNYKTII